MTVKGNYVNGNLACQNFGDCSYIDIAVSEQEQDKKQNEVKTYDTKITRMVEKFVEIMALSLFISIIILFQ